VSSASPSPGSSSASSSVTTEGAELSTAGSYAALVAEHAAFVIAHSAISFDAKLGIFTESGTVEPRVVQLFVWYFMNIMVSLVITSITRTVLLQVSKDV